MHHKYIGNEQFWCIDVRYLLRYLCILYVNILSTETDILLHAIHTVSTKKRPVNFFQ